MMVLNTGAGAVDPFCFLSCDCINHSDPPERTIILVLLRLPKESPTEEHGKPSRAHQVAGVIMEDCDGIQEISPWSQLVALI